MSDYEKIISADKDEELGGVSTGLPNLDRAIGHLRGFPIGRMTLLTGRYSTGKTSLALFALAQAQRKGMDCVWVDTEMAFDKHHATMSGVDIKQLKLIKQTEYAEKVLDTMELYLMGNDKVKPHKNVFMVLDSFQGLSVRDEVEATAEAKDFGAKAKMFSRFLRKIKTPVYMNKSILVVMGYEYKSMTMPVYMILAGGDGMEKTPSLWIDLKKKPSAWLNKGDERVGEVIMATLKKNKVGGLRYAEAELQFVWGDGWNPTADILADALEQELITKSGNTYWFKSSKIGTKSKLDEWMKIEENVAFIKEQLQELLTH